MNSTSTFSAVALSAARWLYAALLRLYPRDFRDEFAEDMRLDFQEALADASSRGGLVALGVCLRELGDLPAALLRLSGSDLIPEVEPFQEACKDVPGTWKAALAAGLPHLLFTLSIYLPTATLYALGLSNSERPSQVTFWVLTGAILLFAWIGGWPRWSASWIGYALVWLLDRIAAIALPGLLAYVLVAAWLLLGIIILLKLARRDWLSGLLAVLPIAPMWVWWLGMGTVGGLLAKAMLYTSIGLMVCLAVALIVRSGRWQTAVLLLLAVMLAAGMPFTYDGKVHSPLLPEGTVYPGWAAYGALGDYLLLLTFTAPLWLLALWRLRRQRRAAG
jgi:hypothetical protein